jgi:hypothetical protein
MPPRRAQPDDAPPERRPEVVLDVVFEDGLLFLAVTNIGTAPAVEVSCKFSRKVRGLGGTQDISKLPLFQNIAFLGPGREIRTLLDSSAAYFARGEPTELSVTTRYNDGSGRTFRTVVEHDLAIYRDLAYVPRGVQTDAFSA